MRFLSWQLRGELLADLLGQALDLRWLGGHQGVGLDVEGEVGRGALQPQLAEASGGEGVVGGVDLDDRELVGVVAQPVLGGGRVGRVEDARLDHGRIGPAGCPDADRGLLQLDRVAGGRCLGLAALAGGLGSGVVVLRGCLRPGHGWSLSAHGWPAPRVIPTQWAYAGSKGCRAR